MKLREWREEVGRSAADVAEELGCTRQAVAKYESGSVPKPDMLAAIITVTGGLVTPNDWYDFAELVPLTFPAPNGLIRWTWERIYRAGEKPPARTPAQELADRTRP